MTILWSFVEAPFAFSAEHRTALDVEGHLVTGRVVQVFLEHFCLCLKPTTLSLLVCCLEHLLSVCDIVLILGQKDVHSACAFRPLPIVIIENNHTGIDVQGIFRDCLEVFL